MNWIQFTFEESSSRLWKLRPRYQIDAYLPNNILKNSLVKSIISNYILKNFHSYLLWSGLYTFTSPITIFWSKEVVAITSTTGVDERLTLFSGWIIEKSIKISSAMSSWWGESTARVGGCSFRTGRSWFCGYNFISKWVTVERVERYKNLCALPFAQCIKHSNSDSNKFFPAQQPPVNNFWQFPVFGL